MWQAIRHRRTQALVIAALSALITACAALTPLYDRAMQQAFVDITLANATPSQTGLQIASRSRLSSPIGNDEPFQRTTSNGLRSTVPTDIAAAYDRGVPGTHLDIVGDPSAPNPRVGELLHRQGACAHVRFAAGACPRRAAEIAVSTADARNFRLAPGDSFEIVENLDSDLGRYATRVRVTITGVYAFHPSGWWGGLQLTGKSGLLDQDLRTPQHDTWLTAGATFDSASAPDWFDPINTLDLRLDKPGTGVDELLTLGPALTALMGRETSADPPPRGQDKVEVATGVPALADLVAKARSQAEVTLPLLMVQLGLLAVVVLWLVLGAATEQRRPEVALARLRGRGAKGARRLVVRELMPVVLAGVPVGAVAAVGLCALARHLLLPGDAPFELRLPFLEALVLAVVVLVGLTYAAARQVTRAPVASLLRRVPLRRTGWRLGAVDAVVIAAAGTAAVAFVTGSLSGSAALAGPALLALVVGLLLSYALVPVAAATGKRLLARGNVVLGVSVLTTARRPATRRVVAIVTVATALLVFSADAVVVGARNRTLAAEQQVGAPMTAELDSTDLVAVRRVLTGLHDSHVTPVVKLVPPGGDLGVTTVAVVPQQFRRIAELPAGQAAAATWDRLAAPAGRPLTLTGTSISMRVTPEKFLPGAGPDTYLQLRLVSAAGEPLTVTLGAVPHQQPVTLTSSVACTAGCTVTGIALSTAATTSGGGVLALSDVTVVGGSTTFPGSPGQWRAVTGDSRTPVFRASTTDAGVFSVRVQLDSGTDHVLPAAYVPARVPALVSGPLRSVRFSGSSLSGAATPMERVGRLDRVPGAARSSAVVDLNLLQRTGSRVDYVAGIQLWFDSASGSRLGEVRTSMRRSGITVGAVQRLSTVQRSFDQSTATWSLQLAVLVGVAGLLIAGLVLLVVAVTTSRLRSRDLASLRMAGLTARRTAGVATGEQLPVIVLAGVAGTVCGIIGARIALPTVPLFLVQPAVSTLDLSTPWLLVLGVALVALLLLGAVGWAAGRSIARRASVQRVRESL